MHFKIKKFVKLHIKNTLVFKLRAYIDVNFSLIPSGKHFKNYMLSLELQRINLMIFHMFYSGLRSRVTLICFSDEP
jgi:hypothetical protein